MQGKSDALQLVHPCRCRLCCLTRHIVCRAVPALLQLHLSPLSVGLLRLCLLALLPEASVFSQKCVVPVVCVTFKLAV